MSGTHESLAQVHNWTNEDGESRQQTTYLFFPNIQSWIDPLGLLSWNTARKQFWKAEAKKERDRIAKDKAKNPGSSPKCKYSERNLKRMSGFTKTRISCSDCRISIMMKRLDCITT